MTMESQLVLYSDAGVLMEWLLTRQVLLSSRALLLAGRCAAIPTPLFVAPVNAFIIIVVVVVVVPEDNMLASSSPSSMIRSSSKSHVPVVCSQHRQTDNISTLRDDEQNKTK